MVRDAPLIFLIAGEPSGDLIASRLMAALKRRTGNGVRFAGIGGPLVAEQGLESLFPYSELSMMGVLEVVPHVPRLLARIRATARTARRLRPAAFVSVDVPGFALRVARRLKGAGFPLIHYVAPTVWGLPAGARGGDRALSRPRAFASSRSSHPISRRRGWTRASSAIPWSKSPSTMPTGRPSAGATASRRRNP